jgi:hypothetical protein
MRVPGRWHPAEGPLADVRFIIKTGRLREASIRDGNRGELVLALERAAACFCEGLLHLRCSAPGFRPGGRGLPFAAARRVSARHPSNFHLRAQMKVTKAKGLEHQPFGPLASATRLLQRLWLENRLRATASVTSLRFKHSVSLRLDPSGPRFGFLCQRLCRSPLAEAWSPNGWC